MREFLTKVNIETGKSENRFNLAQLDQQLVFKNGEAVVRLLPPSLSLISSLTFFFPFSQDLRLRDEERELIYKGPLKKRGGTQSESAELQVYLFDHAILMVKQKSKNEQYKVYRKVRPAPSPFLPFFSIKGRLTNAHLSQPIPLELLVVAPVDDAATLRGGVVRPKSLMARGSSTAKLLPSSTASSQPPPGVDKNNKQGFALTFIHLGRRGYQITLWASTWTGRKKWLEKIEERQNELRERSLVFETLPLSAGYFVGTNRLICAAPFGASLLFPSLLQMPELMRLESRQRQPHGLRYRQRRLPRRPARQEQGSRQGHLGAERHSARRAGRAGHPHRSRRFVPPPLLPFPLFLRLRFFVPF